MQFDPSAFTMVDLLEPGHHQLIYTHFGLDEATATRFQPVIDNMAMHINRLIIQIDTDVDDGNRCECHLLKTAMGMIDQYAKPTSLAEFAFVIYMVSRLIDTALRILCNHKGARSEAASITRSYGNSTATA